MYMIGARARTYQEFSLMGAMRHMPGRAESGGLRVGLFFPRGRFFSSKGHLLNNAFYVALYYQIKKLPWSYPDRRSTTKAQRASKSCSDFSLPIFSAEWSLSIQTFTNRS
jgi:hypothetical protein